MIRLLKQLWLDEAGYLLSAEAVTVGTVGVLGATAGMGALSESINDELTESALAIRSLDQSYSIRPRQGRVAWTAGSSFTQSPVESARADLSRSLDVRRESRPAQAGGSQMVPFAVLDRAAPGRQQPQTMSPEDREALRKTLQRQRQAQAAVPFTPDRSHSSQSE